MANHDRAAATTTYKETVVANLKKVFHLWVDYDKYGSNASLTKYNDDALWWAQAAIYAYKAYGDSALLETAVATWNHVSTFALTAAQAKAGSLSGKSFTISPTCDKVTMAGGVFWRPTASDQGINSITTGLYTTLSAYLAEITKDSKYTNAAIAGATWIKAHNLKNYIVLDGVNGHDCSRSPSSWLFTYNSGKFIEGLSVLADVTGDSQWRKLMVNVVAASVKSGDWQGSDGIIIEGASAKKNNDGVGFKAVFIRGLHEALYRNPSNRALCTLIHSYVDVQYNALLDLAANENTYSSDWNGPPQNFTTWGQLASLDVFVAAITAN
ncbi:hypothetical protein H0H87_007180 [Tephrocybe sp. NHM501043]|nr:hypothetical protein H0H87_007180 [Tephrocybe sp. NHM501043]